MKHNNQMPVTAFIPKVELEEFEAICTRLHDECSLFPLFPLYSANGGYGTIATESAYWMMGYLNWPEETDMAIFAVQYDETDPQDIVRRLEELGVRDSFEGPVDRTHQGVSVTVDYLVEPEVLEGFWADGIDRIAQVTNNMMFVEDVMESVFGEPFMAMSKGEWLGPGALEDGEEDVKYLVWNLSDDSDISDFEWKAVAANGHGVSLEVDSRLNAEEAEAKMRTFLTWWEPYLEKHL